MTGAVIVAAGRGTRMGGVDKCALSLAGEPILLHSVRAFAPVVDRLVVVVAPDRVQAWERVVADAAWPRIDAIVPGGDTRAESVHAGLAALNGEMGSAAILIHDGARPLVSARTIRQCLEAADAYGAAIAAIPVTDTIKRVHEGIIIETPDRSALWAAQTPQGFRANLLHAAFAWARKTGQGPFTDEAGLIEAYGHPVHVVQGDVTNIKVTNREDMIVAEALLAARSTDDG
jgi:2-C-methyl-D-erythritol 4-phosphate cytidylyltransferase